VYLRTTATANPKYLILACDRGGIRSPIIAVGTSENDAYHLAQLLSGPHPLAGQIKRANVPVSQPVALDSPAAIAMTILRHCLG
jgi:hypothetical protein